MFSAKSPKISSAKSPESVFQMRHHLKSACALQLIMVQRSHCQQPRPVWLQRWQGKPSLGTASGPAAACWKAGKGLGVHSMRSNCRPTKWTHKRFLAPKPESFEPSFNENDRSKLIAFGQFCIQLPNFWSQLLLLKKQPILLVFQVSGSAPRPHIAGRHHQRWSRSPVVVFENMGLFVQRLTYNRSVVGVFQK